MKRRDYPPTESDIPLHGFAPYDEFHRERVRAHLKHKDKPGGSMEMKAYTDHDWSDVVMEELGEVSEVRNAHLHCLLTDREARERLREELVQVGAMIAAWIGAIDTAYCCDTRDQEPDDEGLFDTECSLPPDHHGDHHSWSGRSMWPWPR